MLRSVQFPSDEPKSIALRIYIHGFFPLLVQHFDGVSNALKEQFRMMQCNVRDRLTPVKEDNEFIQGVQVKVKNPQIWDIIRSGAKIK